MADTVPSGRIVVNGVILDSEVDNLNTNKIRLSILTKDPYTGESIRLENVVLKQNNPSMPDAIGENQPVIVTIANYEAYRRRNSAAMSATVSPTEVPASNNALPDHVKVKSKIDAFSSRPSAICKSFSDKSEDLKERMGMIYKRKDLTIIQGRDAGASPSIIIHQGNGDVCVADGSGRQFVNLNGQKGISMNAGQIDSGSSMKVQNSAAYGGQSGMENPVGDVSPQGTIVSPHPKLLPNVTKIKNTIIPIMDMIDLGRACDIAVKMIYSADERKKQSRLNEIEELKNNNTTESYNAQMSKDVTGNPKSESTLFNGIK